MRRLARLLRPCKSFQTIGSPSFDFRRFILHAEPLRIHGHYSASSLLWIHPTPRFAFASARSPKFLSELSTRVPPMPRRVSSAQVSSAESCWLHDVRTLATRDFVTRLHERGSLALSLIRLSGETRAHRSRTTLRFVYVGLRPRSGSARTTLAPPSERPDGRWISAILTVRRLLYSNGFLPPFSSAEFCSAYQSLPNPQLLHHSYSTIGVRPSPPPKKSTHSPINSPSLSFQLLIFFCCFSISSYVR